MKYFHHPPKTHVRLHRSIDTQIRLSPPHSLFYSNQMGTFDILKHGLQS